MARTRSNATQRIVMYWRDIPSMVTIKQGRERGKAMLPNRFQHAIDRAAAVAGLTTTHDYVQEWRTESGPLDDGDVAAQLDQQCAELEAAYPRERLEALVANGGLEPASGDGRAAEGTDADPTAEVDNSAPTIEELASTNDTIDPNDELDSP